MGNVSKFVVTFRLPITSDVLSSISTFSTFLQYSVITEQETYIITLCIEMWC